MIIAYNNEEILLTSHDNMEQIHEQLETTTPIEKADVNHLGGPGTCHQTLLVILIKISPEL